MGTSILSVIGGALLLVLVPDGPYRTTSKKIDLSSFITIFKNKPFRAAAFGYFGHMWELYTFWTFVPLVLKHYASRFNLSLQVSYLSFLIISIGGVGCILGGYLSEKFKLKTTSVTALALSGLCCVLSPIVFSIPSSTLLILFLLFWGVVVIADSPLLSTLIAQNAKPDKKGTALTIVNCIGYCITIASIQLIALFIESTNLIYIFIVLAIGPILGVVALIKNKNLNTT